MVQLLSECRGALQVRSPVVQIRASFQAYDETVAEARETKQIIIKLGS
jgi:hypothetical protein